MKHLSAEKLAILDSCWKSRATQPLSPKQKRIRLRLYLIYLLIRHGGLRLGEVLSLDDNRDLVFSTSTIHIAGSRDIQMQEPAMAALLHIVEDPVLSELHGSLTHIDPGYVRKNFYLVADLCGIGRAMGGPRVLRHSRGVELLEHGVPVSITQKFLGLQSPVQAVQLQEFQDSEAREILSAHLRRETLLRTSARNAFAGSISRITESKNIAEVTLTTLSGHHLHAILSMESMRNLNLRKGQTVTATVKAPGVILSPAGTDTSCANNYSGTILFIKEGVLDASVRLRLDDGTGMAALTDMESVRRLGLKEGMPCTASFSALSVVIALN